MKILQDAGDGIIVHLSYTDASKLAGSTVGGRPVDTKQMFPAIERGLVFAISNTKEAFDAAVEYRGHTASLAPSVQRGDEPDSEPRDETPRDESPKGVADDSPSTSTDDVDSPQPPQGSGE